LSRAIKSGLGVVLVLVVLTAAAVVGAPIVASRYTWVAIAGVNLSAGTRIEEGLAWLKVWPVDTVPSGAIHTLESVWGKYLLSNKTAGDILSPADVTDVKPKPRSPKPGYEFIFFAVSRATAGTLQIGDAVDVTLRLAGGGDPYTAPTVTHKENWVIAIIDYEDPQYRPYGFVKVSLEIKYEEGAHARLGGGERGHYLPAGMVVREIGGR